MASLLTFHNIAMGTAVANAAFGAIALATPDILLKNFTPIVGKIEAESVVCDLVRRSGIYFMGIGALFYVTAETVDPLIKRRTALVALGWTVANLAIDQMQKANGRWIKDPIMPAGAMVFFPTWLYVFLNL